MPPRPICFMIMPYGKKETQALPGSGPAKVDFDALWQKAFAPAIRGLGYDAIRADQDLGALIIQEMLERLALSDLVVADMTVPNVNVYYEVGVRHAAKENGCVLLGADWSRPFFDVNQMRRVQYPLPDGEISDETASLVQTILRTAIPGLAEGMSPVFQSLPGFPSNVDPARAKSFAAFVRELADFQGKVHAARRASQSQRKDRALKLRDEYLQQPVLTSSVALELLLLLRDSTDWETTLDYIDRLPEKLRRLPLVREQRCLAQSKVGNHLDAIGALESLIKLSGDSSERQGLIGGRYKKLFVEAINENDRALYLDRAIAHYERGMRLDLNNYYPSSNLPRLYRERGQKGDQERALAVAHVARIAWERANERDPDDPWLKLTLLGAAFDDGDVSEAQALYSEIRKEGPAAWILKTTLDDLQRSVKFVTGPERRAALEEIFGKVRDLAVSNPGG